MISNLAQWSAIVAFLVPLALSLINQSKWSSAIKAVVFFIVSLIAAAGTTYFQGDFTGKRFLDSALIVVGAAAAFYHGWWKPSGIAPQLERETDLAKAKLS